QLGELLDEPMIMGPFPSSASALAKHNLVLAGDAAGFFDPITGEGMSLALQSAHDAASSIDAFLREGKHDVIQDYERRQRARARNSMLLARLCLFLARRPALGRRAIANMNRRPATFEKLVAINSGDAELRHLRPRDALALLLGR